MCKPNITKLERLGSVAAGSAVMASGIVNVFSNPSRSLIKILAGGLLIWRGGSGFCPVNAMLGIDRTVPKETSEPVVLNEYEPE